MASCPGGAYNALPRVPMPNPEAAAAALRPNVTGTLVLPTDASYDSVRRVHNGLIDRRPAIILQCRGTADVQAAVRAAREHGLEIAVRGGGHNVAGNAMCDGGLVIDLSLMRGVQVDPKVRRVRAQGGTTWGDYNRETQLYGLATTGGVVSTTGIAGLTLGGGLGWLMGKHGLAVDNLRNATLVTAAGGVIRVSDDEDPDLFWAIRGGGGNFGVATWLEYDTYPVGPIVTGGLVAHPFSAAQGRAALLSRHHRRAARRVHDLRRPDPRPRRIGGEAGRRSSCATSGISMPGPAPSSRSSGSGRRSWT